MKSTKKFFTLLFFSIAVAFTGCPAPVGSLRYSIDYIKAVPSKFVYGKNDWFKPAQHVKVVGVFGGVEDIIDIDKVKIKIIEDPGFIDNEIPVDDNKEGLVLEFEGPKAVVISYNNMETRYNIAVGAPGVGEEGGWGDGGTGSSSSNKPR
jgi:hypothetical protein